MSNLGELHFYMKALDISPVPFLNPGYENAMALERRLPDNLLPKRTSTIEAWKTRTWTAKEARAKTDFVKTEDPHGRNVSSAGVFLEGLDNRMRDQTTSAVSSDHRLVVSGTADIQKRSNIEVDHLDP